MRSSEQNRDTTPQLVFAVIVGLGLALYAYLPGFCKRLGKGKISWIEMGGIFFLLWLIEAIWSFINSK